MKRSFFKSVSLSLILVFGLGTVNQLNAANGDREDEKPFRLYATAGVAPMGIITSFNNATVNGIKGCVHPGNHRECYDVIGQ